MNKKLNMFMDNVKIIENDLKKKYLEAFIMFRSHHQAADCLVSWVDSLKEDSICSLLYKAVLPIILPELDKANKEASKKFNTLEFR